MCCPICGGRPRCGSAFGGLFKCEIIRTSYTLVRRAEMASLIGFRHGLTLGNGSSFRRVHEVFVVDVPFERIRIQHVEQLQE